MAFWWTPGIKGIKELKPFSIKEKEPDIHELSLYILYNLRKQKYAQVLAFCIRMLVLSFFVFDFSFLVFFCASF